MQKTKRKDSYERYVDSNQQESKAMEEPITMPWPTKGSHNGEMPLVGEMPQPKGHLSNPRQRCRV
jgi:hypothetical protein